MKKIILALCIATLTVTSIKAQASLGFKGGVSFASIMGDTPRGLKFRTAYNFGLVAEIETSSSTSVQPEIMYSSQGFHYDGGLINGEDIAEDNYKLDYLNVPIVFKYYFSEGASLEAGPQVGFLLSAKTADNTINNSELRNNLTNASFDFLVGFGYKFDTGFSLNARYVGGLTNIWKGYNRVPPPGFWYYDYGKRNSVFQLTVGYYFN